MCGRYILISKKRIKNLLNLEIQPCYNISPSMRVLILNDNFSPIFMKWGFRNKVKEKNINIFNVRIETIKSKLLFKKFRKCIFLSNGYFEWKNENSLNEKEINSWLNDEYNYSSRFDEKILNHQVSNSVNSVKNNSINNIKKLEA